MLMQKKLEVPGTEGAQILVKWLGRWIPYPWLSCPEPYGGAMTGLSN